MGIISSIYNSGNEIKKFYLGSQELNLAYLGDLLVYNGIAEDLNSHTLAKYTFDNTIGDCLPTFTGITTDDYSVSDRVNGTITTRTICSDLDEIPTITRISFKNQTSLLTVDYLRVDSNITTMSNMFYYCSKLTSLNVSNWNTQNVTDMSYMFYWCSNLTSLNLTSFNTQKVTTMHRMFGSCSNLTSLNLTSFNTQNVTSMHRMFQSCSKLTSLDVSNWNTQKVTDMSYMFGSCSNLTSLNLTSFNTQKVTNNSYIFRYWTSDQTVYIGEKWTIDVSSYKANFIRLVTYPLDTENRNKSGSS